MSDLDDPQGGVLRASHRAMGCRFEIVTWGAERALAEEAVSAAFSLVDTLEDKLSIYKPTSEVSQINSFAAERPVRIDPEVFRLIQGALIISHVTEGAFDITAGPLVALWGFESGETRKPSQDEIERALKLVGAANVLLEPRRQAVSFARPGMRINLGAYGKGYAVDCVVEALLKRGVSGALVHAGTSTAAAIGEAPGGGSWMVGIRDPREPGRRLERVELKNESISTSGDYEQFFVIDGRRFSHVIDPRTGWPARGTMSASVICESAATGDALSTAAMVLGESRFLRVTAALEGLRTIFVSEQ